MIKTKENVFVINTEKLSYVFHADETGLLFHDYFGKKIDLVDFDVKALSVKASVMKGTTTIYDVSKNDQLSMDMVPLEFSFPHKGDYRTTPILLKTETPTRFLMCLMKLNTKWTGFLKCRIPKPAVFIHLFPFRTPSPIDHSLYWVEKPLRPRHISA